MDRNFLFCKNSYFSAINEKLISSKMGYKCSRKDCESNDLSHGVSLHKFPRSDPELQHWIDFVGENSGWQPKPSSRLCSLHFRASEYVGKRLKDNAIPTVSIDMDVDDDEFTGIVTEGEKSYSKIGTTDNNVPELG